MNEIAKPPFDDTGLVADEVYEIDPLAGAKYDRIRHLRDEVVGPMAALHKLRHLIVNPKKPKPELKD